jgi:hypothetical protein
MTRRNREKRALQKARVLKVRLRKVLDVVQNYGHSDGDHHKQRGLDQIARIILAAPGAYEKWRKQASYGWGQSDDSIYSEWDEGTE